MARLRSSGRLVGRGSRCPCDVLIACSSNSFTDPAIMSFVDMVIPVKSSYIMMASEKTSTFSLYCSPRNTSGAIYVNDPACPVMFASCCLMVSTAFTACCPKVMLGASMRPPFCGKSGRSGISPIMFWPSTSAALLRRYSCRPACSFMAMDFERPKSASLAFSSLSPPPSSSPSSKVVLRRILSSLRSRWMTMGLSPCRYVRASATWMTHSRAAAGVYTFSRCDMVRICFSTISRRLPASQYSCTLNSCFGATSRGFALSSNPVAMNLTSDLCWRRLSSWHSDKKRSRSLVPRHSGSTSFTATFTFFPCALR
mmetsp:Transcript_39228/g.100228  ORF Transcript_39228/g.100228 Transcript_39228/m.100228 type:complete len:312 (-) Transcript_39228:487-1422(-)